MSGQTKITLSAAEVAAAGDPAIILTKTAVLKTAAEMFKDLVPYAQAAFQSAVAKYSIRTKPPKISKGENYKGFPYLILDHPACFAGEDIFAVRTMFLWGNFFSVTLHLRGAYKELFADALLNSSERSPALMICINSDEWQHDFGRENYLPLIDLSSAQKVMIAARPFLKVAFREDVNDWNVMPAKMRQHYAALANIPG